MHNIQLSIYMYNIYIYPLVNCYISIWKDPPCLMGKSTISTGPFSIAIWT